jgi:endonuclease III related protein
MGATDAIRPETQIREIYRVLGEAWGPQHWWPAQSRFEVIVGAFLTQNTSWTNVELAMRQLRAAKALTIEGIRRIPLTELEKLVRSSGYFHQKARRLKNFVRFVDENFAGSLTRMFSESSEKLREQLLSLEGVGPETADSILLYAGQHAVFVIDTYTRRLAARHEIAAEGVSYNELRALFIEALEGLSSALERGTSLPKGASHKPSRMSTAKRSQSSQVFNDMHGFMVAIGKNYCHKLRPNCQACPLGSLLPARH